MASRENANVWTRNAVRGAFSAMLAMGPMAAPAYAQNTERVTASGVYNADRYHAYPETLGQNPVTAHPGEILSTLQIQGTVDTLAPTTADWAESDLLASLRVLNGYKAEGGLNAVSDSQLIAQVRGMLAGAERVGGATQRVDVTEILRSNGYSVGQDTHVYFQAISGGEDQIYLGGTQRANNTTGVGPIPIPHGYDSLAVVGAQNRAANGVRITMERTTQSGVESSITDAYDFCGNNYSAPEAPVVAATRVENPCINVRVRAPRGVQFDNEHVQARVLVLDMNTGNTVPVSNEECPIDTGQIQMNCTSGTDCRRVLDEAAQHSPGLHQVVEHVRSTRGRDAAISQIFIADARINIDEQGSYITVPVHADRLNENFVVAVCFDWDNGGSSVDVIHHPGTADAHGFIHDQLIMEGNGNNMDVFRGHRRVSRGADQTN